MFDAATVIFHMKREADFGILFRHWLRANPRHSCAFELKQTSGTSIPFSCLEDHQETYLMAIKGPKGVLIRVQGVAGEPDYVYLRNAPACVVVKIGKEFHIIDIDQWANEKRRSKRRSLTGSRAREISILSVKL